jgi:hypothetical protein
MAVVVWRNYFDMVEEVLASTTVSDPPLYVQYTPKLFNAWHKWSANYKESPDAMMPLGQKVGPVWMQREFEGLEDFYQYYLELLEKEVIL